MTERSVTVQTSSSNPPFDATARQYELSDDLARLCLPQEFRDSHRMLAWVNSICALFLAVGLVGLKAPKVIEKPINEPQEIVPVVFTPPEEPQKPQVQEEQPTEPQPQDAPSEAPPVVTIVAPANAPNIAFSVPVQGPVAIAPTAQMAPPPPAKLPEPAAPPRPVKFNPTVTTDGGYYPEPRYPQAALRNRWQGTVVIRIEVAASGDISSVNVQKSSGHSMLDDAATDVIKRWRFPAGDVRIYVWDCTFKMN